MLVVALAALALIVRDVGLAHLARDFALVGVWFVPIVLQEAGAHLLNTRGLYACFPRDREAIGFWRMVLVRLAGETVNMTTPTATVGGEVLKVSLLSRHAPAERIAAGVSQGYATQMLAQMLFVAFMLPIALPRLALPAGLRLWLAGAVLGGLVFSTVFTGAVRSGTFGRVARVLRFVGLGREGGRTDTATQAIDEESRALAREGAAFRASVVWFVLGWAWGIVEAWLILTALRVQDVGLADAVAIETLAVFWDAVMFFVPAQIGTREFGLGGILLALGQTAEVGFTFGLVRRARQIAWAVLGLVALALVRRGAPS